MKIDLSMDKITLTIPQAIKVAAALIIAGIFYAQISDIAVNTEKTADTVVKLKEAQIIFGEEITHLKNDVSELKVNDKQQDRELMTLKGKSMP